MNSGLLKSLTYFLVILVSYTLKKKKIFTPEHYQGISKLMVKVTLPCVVIAGFRDFNFTADILIVVMIGLVSNIVMALIGMAIGARRGRDEMLYNSFVYSGYNVGGFSLPLIQSYMPTANLVPVFLFDTGNALMSCGGLYAICASLKPPTDGQPKKSFVRNLISSLPLDLYILMLLLGIFHISLPSPIYDMAGTIGSANAILAMFTLGGAMEISFRKELLRDIATTIIIRYLGSALFAFIIYKFLPFDLLIRQILAILFFSPGAILAAVFTKDLDLDNAKAGLTISICIPISLVIITILINSFHLG